MKLVLLLLLTVFSFANENDELARELEQYRRDAEKLLQQIQEKTAGMDTTKLSQARGKIMELAADERFVQSVTDLWNHPKRNTLLVAELIFLVVMFFVKAWRQAKARNWFTKLLTGMFLGLFTWIGVLLILPYIVLGEPFKVVMTTLWRVFVG